MGRTSETPDDREGGGDEEVDAFEEEAVPEAELGAERNRVGEESNVPLCCVRRGGDAVCRLRTSSALRESEEEEAHEGDMNVGHEELDELLLDVERLDETWEPGLEDMSQTVLVE